MQVWNHLQVKAANKPVSGNQDGSYLTFFSSNGLTFGIINIIGNFGTVFCDQAYWVRSSMLLPRLCPPPPCPGLLSLPLLLLSRETLLLAHIIVVKVLFLALTLIHAVILCPCLVACYGTLGPIYATAFLFDPKPV